MDPRQISSRLHDILRIACRVRQPGPGSPVDLGLAGLDEVKAGLRDLIRSLGDEEAPRLPPRIRATAGAFPEGRIAGTRVLVQHRRRVRGIAGMEVSKDARPDPFTPQPMVIRLPAAHSARTSAEAHFAQASATRVSSAAGR